ncbi:MAG: saccharopine dehydrogenase C-terminal domain-containing protein [Bacteroidota bacterium]
MKNIVLFGAGRSSIYLVEYLQAWCVKNNYMLIIGDKDVQYVQDNVKEKDNLQFQTIDIFDHEKVEALIKISELVISLLPAALHMHIAHLCLDNHKHMATASYVSDEMKAIHDDAINKGLIFLNECGLDPGIDHMSAMQLMDNIKSKGGIINSFESYCGGLVANACDGDNPWKYKFSWNPRNVVVAGQGAPAQFLLDGQLKVLPYHQLFAYTKDFTIGNHGTFEAYPNRDSLKYRPLYGLDHIATMVRGTFRKQGYASAWQVLVVLGLTDDTTKLYYPQGTTMQQWLTTYMVHPYQDLKNAVKTATHCTDADIAKLEWLGLFGNEVLPLYEGTSAQILEEILKIKWLLLPNDRDMVVMLHKIGYQLNGENKAATSTLVIEGESNTHTAMAKTVGLPLAIACRLILENKISQRGVVVPVDCELYTPVLEELKGFGIHFIEN